MNSSRTTRSRSRGTVNSSKPVPQKPKSTGQKSKISKYFAKSVKEESDSPYKDCLSEVKSAALDSSEYELDNFKTPKAINKVSKISNKPVKTTRKRKKSRQPLLTKFVEDNLKHSDVNPEHLQLALALSESSYEKENPGETSSQEKRNSLKEIFEKYGLGYKNKSTELKRNTVKKSKKSRYRFVTPILNIRTEEDRQQIISSKVSLILAQNNRKLEKINHETGDFLNKTLQDYRSTAIFSLNNLELEQLNERGLHVDGLGIEPSPAFGGRLLKDWRKIPGREPTPERDTNQNGKFQAPEAKLNESGQFYYDGRGLESRPEDCKVSESTNDKSPSPRIVSPIVSSASKKRKRSSDSCSSSDEIKNSFENMSQTSPKSAPRDDKSPLVKVSEQNPTSPDLFDFDDETSSANQNSSLCVSQLRSSVSATSIESIDLTQSDEEKQENKESFHLRVSEFDSISHRSDLNITDYVENLLTNYNQPRKFERVSTSEESESSQSVIYISDEELNYSSVFASSPVKKVSYDLSDEEIELYQHKAPLVDDSTLANQELDSDYIPPITTQTNNPLLNKQDETKKELNELNASVLNDFSVDLNKLEKCDDIKNQNQTVTRISSSDISFLNNQEPIESPHLNNSALLDTLTYQFCVNEESFNYDKEPKTAVENDINEDRAPLHSIPDPDNTPNKNFPKGECSAQTVTPNDGVIIKTKNVTPMANYDAMDTPKIVKELDKLGLKPLKRPKGVKMLKYIYESTHPAVGDENSKIVKNTKPQLFKIEAMAEIKNDGDLIFEKKRSKRISTCAVPLHIVWHNFIMSNPEIRESILLYEPIQVEVLHLMLKEQGYKFDLQDLLTFLDGKCISVRTQGQHNARKKPK